MQTVKGLFLKITVTTLTTLTEETTCLILEGTTPITTVLPWCKLRTEEVPRALRNYSTCREFLINNCVFTLTLQAA